MPTFAYAGTETANVIGCEFFPDGRLELRQTIAVDPNEKGLPNGSMAQGVAVEWVLVHPGGEVVYALISSWDHAIGTIRVCTVGAAGELTNFGDLISTGGYQPCHAIIDGSLMLIAHYLSGNVTVYDIRDAKCPKQIQNAPMPNLVTGAPWSEGPFQAAAMGAKTPLCHGLATSPVGDWLVAADAGQTAIVTFKYDRASATPLGDARHQPVAPPAPVGEHNIVSMIGNRPRKPPAAVSSLGGRSRSNGSNGNHGSHGSNRVEPARPQRCPAVAVELPARPRGLTPWPDLCSGQPISR